MKEFMKALDAIVEEKKIDKKIVVEAMHIGISAQRNSGANTIEIVVVNRDIHTS